MNTTVILLELYPPLRDITIPVLKNNKNSGYAVKLWFIIYIDEVQLSISNTF